MIQRYPCVTQRRRGSLESSYCVISLRASKRHLATFSSGRTRQRKVRSESCLNHPSEHAESLIQRCVNNLPWSAGMLESPYRDGAILAYCLPTAQRAFWCSVQQSQTKHHVLYQCSRISVCRAVQVAMGSTRTVAMWSLASLLIAAAIQINAQNLTNNQRIVREAAKTIAGIFPASRAELYGERAKEVNLEDVVNILVAEVNSLTPVITSCRLAVALYSVIQVQRACLANQACTRLGPALPGWAARMDVDNHLPRKGGFMQGSMAQMASMGCLERLVSWLTWGQRCFLVMMGVSLDWRSDRQYLLCARRSWSIYNRPGRTHRYDLPPS